MSIEKLVYVSNIKKKKKNIVSTISFYDHSID